MDDGMQCGCNRSLAVVCGVFSALGVTLLLAGNRCLDAGGRLGDSAWTCEVASGAVNSLWGLVTPGISAMAVLAGIAAYFVVSVLGRWWLFRHG